MDAALSDELDQKAVLAFLPQDYSAERVHQLTLILFGCLRTLNHYRHCPLDGLTPSPLQLAARDAAVASRHAHRFRQPSLLVALLNLRRGGLFCLALPLRFVMVKVGF